VRDIEEIPGEGVRAVVSGRRIFVGKVPDGHIVPSVTGVTVVVTVDGETVGYITASDSVKSDAPDAIRALAALGVTRSFILTGDREESARAVAEAVGIGGVRAGLLPGDKVAELEKIMKESAGVTCYVGDGINDAPVLARADVGFAMGAMGSDAAIEAADVVLMDDSVMRLPLAVKIAKKTVRIAKENIAFSIAVKGACLLLGAFGAVGMPVAIFADVGVMILAVLNAARALGVKNKNCYRAK
jgi:Cd2+/Zn2+-exporting ATPase